MRTDNVLVWREASAVTPGAPAFPGVPLRRDPRQERTGTMRVFKAWKGIAALRRSHHLEEDPSPLAS